MPYERITAQNIDNRWLKYQNILSKGVSFVPKPVRLDLQCAFSFLSPI